MSEDVFAKKLEAFKQDETPEVVLFLADNPDLVNIVVAWTNTTVGRSEDLTALCDESENGAWGWLWFNAAFSEEELLAKSGHTRYRFRQKLEKLIGNRSLYPDGTVNSFVQRYLREKVLQLLRSRPKKRQNTASRR